MKKIILIIFTLCILCSCGTSKKAQKLLPTRILSLNEAQEIIGDSYTLKMKNDAALETEDSISVKYMSESLGEGDPVFIELFTDDDNYKSFKNSLKSRTDSILVKGLDSEAYISYPSLHMYLNDFYVKITAGSGDDDNHAELLVKLGKVAEENIKIFCGENWQS